MNANRNLIDFNEYQNPLSVTIVLMRLVFAAWLVLLVSAVVSGVGEGPAFAAEATGRVALVPFTGLHANEPQSVVERALKRRIVVVQSGDLGEVVLGGGVDFIVTGVVDVKRHVVTVTVLNAAGDVVPNGQLTYPLLPGPTTRGRHMSPEQFKQLAVAVSLLVSVSGIPAVPEEVHTPEAADDKAAPVAAVPQEDDPEKVPFSVEDLNAEVRRRVQLARRRNRFPPRPPWAVLAEITLGPLVSSRSLSFDTGLPRGYRPGTAGGLFLDGAIYPLAVLHHRARGIFSGLGVGLTLLAPFWPDTRIDGTSEQYPTAELAVEGQVRWRFALRRLTPRVDLTVLGGGGLHRYTIEKAAGPFGPTDVSPPDVAYRYVTFGLLLRVWPQEWISPFVALQAHYVPDAGSVEDLARYGRATTYGIKLRAGLEVRVWRRLSVGAQAYFERFALSFDGTPGRGRIADSSEDMYFGGMATVAYAY
jgi:hypothetical protein